VRKLSVLGIFIVFAAPALEAALVSYALEVKTSFGFDACGNTNSVSVVGKDRNGVAMPARVTGTSYGTRCQFAESVTNPLTQTATTAYRYDLGVPSSSTDPNLIVTSWAYDSFARRTQETRPDGTYSKLTYYDCVAAPCWGLTDLRFRTNEQLYSNTSALVRQSDKYSDGMDRIRRVESDHALGTHVVDETTTYDGLGRKTRVDLPWSTSNNGYHLYGYDSGNRILSDVLYTGAGVSYRTIGMGYSGQTVTITDPKGFPVTKITDVAGNLRWVTDPNNNGTIAGTTKYTYDAFNNAVTILDANGNTSSYQYNIRGFKVSAADADTGAWTFVPDSLNELVSQTDAKNQTTTFGYDPLGRMTSRIELTESSTATTWTYGTNAALHEIGRINAVSKPDGYAESYIYDSIGRPQTVRYTEDAVIYPFDYTYNTFGAVDTLTYPTSTSGVRFALKSVYDAYGYLNQVKDNSAGTIFWTLQSNNDSSLPTGELLGNGVKVTTSYTPHTNEMVTRQEGSGGSTTNLQNLSYAWDLNGNLSQRQDLRQSLTEIFTLDAMNRVLSATLNGSQTLAMTYYASGNIRKKSDVSASDYVYGSAAHPHAVTTAGSWTLAYDANGNMNSRAGSTITWYSYNLPNLINYGTSSAQFFYNASHQRWKQIANYSGTVETTHYVGGLLEIMTKGGVTEYRHQIPAGSGSAVYTRSTSGTNSTYYATSDHLGSADLVMDSAGTVLARESFTPFGARRGSNWQGVPTTADYTTFDTTTRRGFTGHEMLDSVSLVHMNGRVYDPYLGRFISADSVVSNLAATQSVNPYSYAWNDPLKYIDPSGHDFGDTFYNIIVAVISIIVAYYTFGALGGGGPEASFWGNVAAGAGAGFVGGFIGTAFMTGNLSAALNGGLTGALGGALFAGVGFFADEGSYGWTIGDKVIAHAAVGCIQAEVSGGNCGKNALAAGLSEAAVDAGWIKNTGGKWGTFKATVEAALVGGSAQAVSGGNFVEGFSTSAAGYLFNSAFNSTKAKILKDDNGKVVNGGNGGPVSVPDDVDVHLFVKTGETFASLGAPEQGWLAFNGGGPWDLQRIGGVFHPEFRDVATIAIGLYSAAAGIPLNDTLAAENARAAFNTYKDRLDQTWTHLPIRNVVNTQIGYDLYNSGRIGNGH
jgi:RHS repeat-associated protein